MRSLWLLPFLLLPVPVRAQVRVTVAVCQLRVPGLDVAANLDNVERWVAQAAAGGAQLCVLPELVDVSFTTLSTTTLGGDRAAPIPGPTTDRLGAIARAHGVWLATAVLERVVGGVRDTSVLIDERGHLVHRQRKGRVYPFLGGEVAFQGNYQDVRAVDTPWGPVVVVNCADIAAPSKRSTIVAERPVLALVSLANPPASELQWLPLLAREAGVPAVGANMVFPPGTMGGLGGDSQVVDARGTFVTRSTAPVEEVRLVTLDLPTTSNRAPVVDLGDTQTVVWPQNAVPLRGAARDDGRPGRLMRATWTQTRGPAGGSFTRPNELETTFVPTSPGVYEVQLSVDDGALVTQRRVGVNVLPAPGVDPHLVGRWTFDGGDARDVSGHGHHGVLIGGPTFTSAVPPGASETSLSFDGVDDCVRIRASPALDATHGLTIAAWYRLETPPGLYPVYDPQYLVNKGFWIDGNYALGVGWLYYLFGSDTVASYEMDCPSLDARTAMAGTWRHATFVLDGSRGEGLLYVDGVLDHRVFFQPAFRPNGNDLYLGVKEPGIGGFLHGQLDDVRIYTRCLSHAEVAALVPGAEPNQPPFLHAGRDRVVFAGQPVFLAGRFFDGDLQLPGLSAAWVDWRLVTGPGRVWFTNPFRPDTFAMVERPGIYEFELRGSDGAHRVYDSVRIEVLEVARGGMTRF